MLLPILTIVAAWTIVDGLRIVGERWKSKPTLAPALVLGALEAILHGRFF